MKGTLFIFMFLIIGNFFISCTRDVGLIIPIIPEDFRDKYIGKFKGIITVNSGVVDSNYTLEFSKLGQFPSDSLIDSNGRIYDLYRRDGFYGSHGFYNNCEHYHDSVLNGIAYFYGPQGMYAHIESWRLYRIK